MKLLKHGFFVLMGLLLVESSHAQTLFKCELLDGKIAFQDTPCVQGKESARIETSDDKEKRARKDKTLHRDSYPAATSSSLPPLKPVVQAPKPPRCPFVPIAGMDTKLVAQQQDMYTELFYVDDSRYSAAAQSAPAAPVPGKREVVDPRIAQCGALSEEYAEVGGELLKVLPKSLPSVRACFQKEAQRLDGENRRLRCGFTHFRLKR